MASIPIPARAESHPNLRPLNVLRDLSAVADLIELCFQSNMDSDGQDYVRQMRRASRDDSFLRWASQTIEGASMPMSGYVWEENGRIVGNASLIPFHHRRKKIHLIANVAVHPEARRRGIARALTQECLSHARQRKADAIWLHVRADNPGAVDLYSRLGFRERFRRTTWLSAAGPAEPPAGRLASILPRAARFWPQQKEWLERAYPDELGWYRLFDWSGFAPGLRYWLYFLFVDMNLRQWAALKDNPSTLPSITEQALQAVLSWTSGGRADPLWLAAAPDADPQAVTALLLHARTELSARRKLVLEHPVGPLDTSIRAAGFDPARTLIWMQAEGATG